MVAAGTAEGACQLVFNGTEFPFGNGQVWRWMVGWLHNNMNGFNATEQYTSNS